MSSSACMNTVMQTCACLCRLMDQQVSEPFGASVCWPTTSLYELDCDPLATRRFAVSCASLALVVTENGRRGPQRQLTPQTRSSVVGANSSQERRPIIIMSPGSAER